MLGNGDGYFNPDSIQVTGLKVAIRKNETDSQIVHDGIFVPDSATRGFKANSGTVLSVGKEANDLYGIEVGDTVRFDQCSCLYDTNPVIVLNGENVIIKMEGDTPRPLKDKIFVKKIANLTELENTGILLPEKLTDVSIGEVLDVYSDEVVQIGDKIIMTSECDHLQGPDGKYESYHQDTILAIVEV